MAYGMTLCLLCASRLTPCEAAAQLRLPTTLVTRGCVLPVAGATAAAEDFLSVEGAWVLAYTLGTMIIGVHLMLEIEDWRGTQRDVRADAGAEEEEEKTRRVSPPSHGHIERMPEGLRHASQPASGPCGVNAKESSVGGGHRTRGSAKKRT